MNEITPENVQEQVNIFRQMQQQIQNLSQQASQMDMTIGETERTLEEIGNVDNDAVLYRAIGSVMKKIDDNPSLVSDLNEEKERMEIRNNSLKNQIKKMNVELAEMQSKLEPVLQNIQGKNDKPSK
jgi:prefoldin beta subunit|tara:strand:- start:2351 stop:2728 length:378 start_codon:yes stop_codon:yes gene_type:complete